MGTGAVIAAICGVIAALVKLYLSAKPSIERKVDEKDKQALRKAVADGDVAAVNAAIDSVSPKASNSSGQPNDQDIARRLSKITDK